eukprot:CAMPEP_0172685250 /NCGR_PEP_ID=MMETSP1074-20121228/20107_1 /TAXON_ID=2916 /ORGANISM="Ceratium fusus, Strain PA161109" /LENGTH=55 /DNA_ID=CAMNT_0013504359 /DNA_START=55 /DNA_END=219 /DNA_ORIENTATION=-
MFKLPKPYTAGLQTSTTEVAVVKINTSHVSPEQRCILQSRFLKATLSHICPRQVC